MNKIIIHNNAPISMNKALDVVHKALSGRSVESLQDFQLLGTYTQGDLRIYVTARLNPGLQSVRIEVS